MFAGEVVLRDTASTIRPNNFIAEPIFAKDAIHQELEVVGGGGVAVQVDGARRLQDALHLQQPHRHEDEVGLHPFPMGLTGSINDGVGGRVAVCQLPVLTHVHVIQGPGILEGGAGGLAANGGFIGAVGIEGRVQVDQVHTGRVHAPHDVQIVSSPDGGAGKVCGGHTGEREPGKVAGMTGKGAG